MSLSYGTFPGAVAMTNRNYLPQYNLTPNLYGAGCEGAINCNKCSKCGGALPGQGGPIYIYPKTIGNVPIGYNGPVGTQRMYAWKPPNQDILVEDNPSNMKIGGATLTDFIRLYGVPNVLRAIDVFRKMI